MKGKVSILGHEFSVKPKANTSSDKDLAIEGGKILKEYMQGKQALDARIVENHKWWKAQHWELFRSQNRPTDPEPVTMYLFNMIANKHADAMDNYPNFNILGRKESDKNEAQMLSKIIPAVYASNRFRKAYSRGWWYKLINGAVPYGQFWDPSRMEGLGDIVVKNLDILNLAWQPGITDLNDSRGLFIVGLEDDDLLIDAYGDVFDGVDAIRSKKIVDVKLYAYDDNFDTTKKSLVVDWYFKQGGKLHLVKFVGDKILSNSTTNEYYKDRGIYDHGEYPVDMDVLFPEEGYPTGFGLVDIAKNPQMYTDKLDQIIMKNAMVSGKLRYLIKQGGAIRKEDLMDLSKDVIEVNGPIDETHVRVLQGKSLDQFIANHRQNKIQEMKEVTANDVFASGEGGKGITAASAIYAMQEAGNKLARDMIGESYDNLTPFVYKTIENIRQFYDQDRDFRIRGDDGNDEYVTYNNQGIMPQQLPPASEYEGQAFDPDTQTFIEDKDYKPKYRKPFFDVTIVPEKKSPYSTVVQNEMAKELFNIGIFNPQRAPEAKMALEMMTFEGKDKIIQKVAENGDMAQQFQQQAAAMQQEMEKMWQVIQHLGGEELLKGGGQVGQQ